MKIHPDDFVQYVQATLQADGVRGQVTVLNGVPYQWTVHTTPMVQINVQPHVVELAYLVPPNRDVEAWPNKAFDVTTSVVKDVADAIASWVLHVEKSPWKPIE
jgi:hypothetical protein